MPPFGGSLMYRIEIENGRPVGVTCDTAAEVRAYLQGELRPNGQHVPHLALVAPPNHGQKSEAVRGFLTKFPAAKPAEVVAALKLTGIDVRPNMVSAIKAKLPKATKRRKRA